MNRDISRWAMLGITLLAAALRLYQLGAKSFWFDECFTFMAVQAPVKASLAALSLAGIYTPFYFFLLRPVVILAGNSEYAVRFLSAAFGIATVPVIYHVGRRFGGKTAGVVAALLLAVNPFHIWYSQDARMYTQMVMFSLLAIDCFVALMRGRQLWILFAVLSSLAYLSHYAAISLLYIQLIYLLPRLRERGWIRRWFLSQVAALAPLTPWLVFVYQAQGLRPAGLGWIPFPGLLAPLGTLWNFTVADVETMTPFVWVLALGTALVYLRGLFPWDQKRKLLVWWLALPVGVLFLLSLRRPYYVDRYLIASLPAYLLLLALGIAAQRQLIWRVLFALIVLVAMIWGAARLYTDPLFAKEEWRGAAAAVEGGLEAGDVVVMQDAETLIGTSVYRTRAWPSVILEPGQETSLLDEALGQHRRVWLIWRSPFESNHRLSKSVAFNVLQVAAPPVRDWLSVHQVALNLSLPGLSVVRVERAQ